MHIRVLEQTSLKYKVRTCKIIHTKSAFSESAVVVVVSCTGWLTTGSG